MALTKAFGKTYSGTESSLDANRLYSMRVQSAITGVVKELRLWAMTSARNVRAGVHADSGGVPGALLASGGPSTSTDGSNTVVSINLSVTASSYYHICGLTDGSGGLARANDAGGGDCRFKNFTYASGIPDPAGTGFTTYTTNEWLIDGYGYEPPDITADTVSNAISYNSTGVGVTVANGEATQGNGKLWLTNNATWGSETIKVEQVVQDTEWADDGTTTFDVVPGDLISGTVYLWIETDSGQINDGYSFGFTAADNTATGSVYVQSPDTSASASQSNTSTGSAYVDSPSSTASSSQENTANGSSDVSSPSTSASASQFNTATGAASISSPTTSATADNTDTSANNATGSVLVSAPGTSAQAYQYNTATGSASVSSPESSASATNVAVNGATGSASTVSPTTSAIAYQYNTATGSVSSTSPSTSVEATNLPDIPQARPVRIFGRRSKMTPGKTIKYASETLLRLEIPATWDRENISQVAVYVTDENGLQLASGFATLQSDTSLGAQSYAEDTEITVDSASGEFLPGDRIMIGSDGEIAEIRKVHSYSSTTDTVVVTPELEYAHADGATVSRMFCTYTVDLTDTTVFTLRKHIWLSWVPNSQDLDEVQHFTIGESAFNTSSVWDDFQTIYPTEFAIVQGRDLTRLEKLGTDFLRDDLRKQSMELDRIMDPEIIRRGLILKLRNMICGSGGDNDRFEYDMSMKEYNSWILSVKNLPIWKDEDGDMIADEEETNPIPDFFETYRSA